MQELFLQWRGQDDTRRVDRAVVRLSHDGISGLGSSVTADYAMSWSLDATDGWYTRQLEVSVHGLGWARRLSLVRHEDGDWSAEAEARGEVDLPPAGLVDVDDVRGAIDCDLGSCPVTNTMPIRRLGLLDGQVPATDLVMAWVEVPSLRVIRSDQVYASGGAGTVRYRSYSRDVHTELTVDSAGLVVEYPGLARRVDAW